MAISEKEKNEDRKCAVKEMELALQTDRVLAEENMGIEYG
jgi:hypothetical protein